MKNKHFSTLVKLIELVLYAVLTHASYYLAFVLRYKNVYFEENIQAYLASAPYITLAVVLILVFSGYLNLFKKSVVESMIMTFIVTTLIAVSTTFVAFFSRSFAFPRTIILIGWLTLFANFSLVKSFTLILIKKLRHKKKYVIVTPRNINDTFLNRTFYTNQNYDDLVHIIFDDATDIEAKLEGIDKVIVDEYTSAHVKDHIITYCIGKPISVYVVPSMFEIAQMNASMSQMVDLPVIKVEQLEFTAERRMVKRCFDLVVSSIVLLIASPVLIVCSLIIKLQDKGPAFYVQDRVTRDNKIFGVIKLRTMIDKAEAQTGAVFATLDDNRITPFGRFLRKHRIDELPQFINVLKGDMSIVGPRPERPEFVKEFNSHITGFSHRHLTKAGITGLAQIMGDYHTSAHDKLKYDLIYLRNANLVFDIKILLLTVKVILMGKHQRDNDFELCFTDYLKQHGYAVTKHTYGYELKVIKHA